MPRHVLCCAVLAACTLLEQGCNRGTADDGKPAETSGAVASPASWIVPLSMTVRSREVMPLVNGVVNTKRLGDGRFREVSVHLVHTLYSAHVIACRGESRKESTHDVDLYELRPTSETEPYEWAFWYRSDRFTSVEAPRLLTGSDGQTYLTWVRLDVPRFVPASEPVERMVALQRLVDLASYPVVSVGLGPLGDVGMWYSSSVKADVEFVDITRNDAAEWVVKVRVPHTGKEYTVVGSGSRWRAQ